MDTFKKPFKSFLVLSVSILSFVTILSCGKSNPQSDSQNDPQGSTGATFIEKFAAIATTDYTGSGAYSLISLATPRTILTNLSPTNSTDVTIACSGKDIYRIERLNFGANGSVVKFNLDNPSQNIYQYSADDADPASQSNPSDIVFVNSNKAYLLRNLNNKLWIINPSATTQAAFKTGEIDLSAYSPDGGTTPPRMTKGLMIGNKLFILLQRLDAFWDPSQASYVVVIDTDTDQEINTGFGDPGLKGIKLDIRNPYGRIIYNGGIIYVAGSIFPDNPGWGMFTWTNYKNFSGIQKINATTYQPDHTLIYNPVTTPGAGTITYLDVLSSSKGYFVEYIGAGNTRLRSFNPTTGVVAASNVANVGDSGDRDISDIALDSEGKLWIADFSIANMGMHILNTTTDTVEEGPIATGLNPVTITFCEK